MGHARCFDSSTPNGSGYTVSGQISSGFIFVNNSQTEIDSPEIEGQNPGTLWWTTWISVNTKQSTSSQAPFAPENGFHSYKCVWTGTSIRFYVDGVLLSTHTGVVPQTPAYAMINHWGTNSTGWAASPLPISPAICSCGVSVSFRFSSCLTGVADR